MKGGVAIDCICKGIKIQLYYKRWQIWYTTLLQMDQNGTVIINMDKRFYRITVNLIMEKFLDKIYSVWWICLDGYVSMILSDPPYGTSYQNHYIRINHPVLKGDEGIDYRCFAHESYRILKVNSHAYFLSDCLYIKVLFYEKKMYNIFGFINSWFRKTLFRNVILQTQD